MLLLLADDVFVFLLALVPPWLAATFAARLVLGSEQPSTRRVAMWTGVLSAAVVLVLVAIVFLGARRDGMGLVEMVVAFHSGRPDMPSIRFDPAIWTAGIVELVAIVVSFFASLTAAIQSKNPSAATDSASELPGRWRWSLKQWLMVPMVLSILLGSWLVLRGARLHHDRRVQQAERLWHEHGWSPVFDPFTGDVAALVPMPTRSVRPTAGEDFLREAAELSTLTTLDLSGATIDEPALVLLQSAPQLRRLNLSGSTISDAGLEQVGQLRLRFLLLSNTQISDAGLAHLKPLGVRKDPPPGVSNSARVGVDLHGTQVTWDGIAQLSQPPGKWELDYDRKLKPTKKP